MAVTPACSGASHARHEAVLDGRPGSALTRASAMPFAPKERDNLARRRPPARRRRPRVGVVQRLAERIDACARADTRAARAARGSDRATRTANSGRSNERVIAAGVSIAEDPAALDERDAIAAVGLVHVRRRDDDRETRALAAGRADPRTRGARPRRRRSSARRAAASRAGARARSRARASASCRPTARRRGGPGTARAGGRSARSGRTRARCVVPNTEAKNRRFSSTLRSG